MSAARQLALDFGHAAPEPEPEWSTGVLPDLTGAYAYVHIIRAPDDPERAARGTGAFTTTSWTADLKASAQSWAECIVALLADGVPRTFNRICVEITGGKYTADMCLGKAPDTALWSLVERAAIEHTLRAPVLFRRTSEASDG